MNLKNEFQSIRDWANERGLIKKGDPKTQVVKLGEEFGELCQALLKQNEEEINDAVGDIVVVLTNFCAQRNIKIEDCINDSYKEIKNRKGKMIKGTFIKSTRNG